MTQKMMVSVIIAALLVGYAVMLYAAIHILVLTNHSFLLNLAM